MNNNTPQPSSINIVVQRPAVPPSPNLFFNFHIGNHAWFRWLLKVLLVLAVVLMVWAIVHAINK
jgi:hypothetical protein